MGDVVTRGSESAFYDLVAKRIGKQKLDEREMDAVFAARLNAALNHQLEGRKPCPYKSEVIEAAWEIAMDMFENDGKLVDRNES